MLKGEAIPEHDRRNLKLLHQSYLHAMLMIANVALIAAIIGGVAFWQIGGWEGITVFSGVIVFVVVLVIPEFYFSKKVAKIGKALGVEKTAEKYDV